MNNMNGYYDPNQWPTNQQYQYGIRQQRYPQMYYDPQYVTGIEGANAYQMPPGVTKMILWDTEDDSFYVKALDEMGRPRIIAWKDFSDHVEPAKAQKQTEIPDLSVYPTKKDIEDLLERTDMTKYLTKDDFEKILNDLRIGDGGRIVRNELNT